MEPLIGQNQVPQQQVTTNKDTKDADDKYPKPITVIPTPMIYAPAYPYNNQNEEENLNYQNPYNWDRIEKDERNRLRTKRIMICFGICYAIFCTTICAGF